MKVESAFSGLEASIVLIAFVVVAAVFSYTVLGAGQFASSKAQGSTYSGIKQSTSNTIMDGYFYGSCDQTTGKMVALTFYIKVPMGSTSVQLDQMKYVYGKDNGVGKSIEPSVGKTGELKTGDRTKVVLNNLDGPTGGSTFSLEIKPPVGSSSLMQRKLSNGFMGGIIY